MLASCIGRESASTISKSVVISSVVSSLTDSSIVKSASESVESGLSSTVSENNSNASINVSSKSIAQSSNTVSSSIISQVIPVKPLVDGNNYKIVNGKITEDVLHNYLNKAITFNGLITTSQYYSVPDGFNPTFNKDFDFIKIIGAKYISRAAYFWSNPKNNSVSSFIKYIKDGASKIHVFDPDIILEASIFETCYKSFVNTVKIPTYVFEEFNLPVENRNFEYTRMKHTDGPYSSDSYWYLPGTGVPDITRTEAKLWYYYWATVYINAGYESIHLGQSMLVAQKDNNSDLRYNMINLREVFEKIRVYAKANARRKFVLLASHAYAPQWVTYSDKATATSNQDRKLIYDFHSFPTRPDDRGEGMDEKGYLPVKITVGFGDAIYGKSAGGHNPQGYYVEENPYLVELDNNNKWSAVTIPTGGVYPYGNDESTWFALQPDGYHDKVLKQFTSSIKAISKGKGHFALPCHQVLASPLSNKFSYKPYNENGDFYLGLNYVNSIKDIFKTYNK